MAGSKHDRTEKPTARRRTDARRKGKIPRSREVGQTAALAAVVIVIVWAGPALMRGLAAEMTRGLARAGEVAQRSVEAGDLVDLATVTAWRIVTLVGPIALTVAITVVVAHTLQGGWNVSTEAIKPDWKRLSPAKGIKRLGFSMGGLETVKMAAAVAVLGILSHRAVSGALFDTVRRGRLGPIQTALVGWDDAYALLRRVVIALIVFAAIDYGLQLWRFNKSMKMTKQEVKDDDRMTQGNPETKGRVRKIQREMFRKRMLAAASKATFVVTNPTHYAVALHYHRETMPAPKVVAKGRGFLATRIRAIAREHDIPIIENPALAQALYKGTEVGEVIPAALFEAVAEVLAYLIRLKHLALS